MADTVGLKLVFRISGIGFALPIGSLVEIREEVQGWLDRSEAAPERGLLGRLPHRGEMIPVRDLRMGFRLPQSEPQPGELLLVLAKGVHRWGILADAIEGIFPDAEFRVHPLPWLLASQDSMPYGRVVVRKGEPLVLCEPDMLEACWGAP
ncbi:hypothetical protein DESUT3_14680 [Desulfuromonas versatilis]|uniref:CheW-like domain-containing protein n=1 Tax=Desulfuromonas versatilis TaxID=2802975 RepID=A0ABM8HR47_9BACT|nr:chemotaxis protein CheW [Desulfuromonas versatilis]BCR04399.1 hypothetical protein DESUT3_14680 [Desulfuromonas versatilis]